MRLYLLVRPEAEADIEESFNWYENECPGLGHEFRNALSSTIDLIRTNPQMFPLIYKQIRRAIVKRFPHSFFFFIAEETVIVTACIHHKRDPKIWKRRR
jgi:plasmid stabilization system protein ParE